MGKSSCTTLSKASIRSFSVSITGSGGKGGRYTKEENVAALKQRRVIAIDHEGKERYQWIAFMCTYAELEHEDRSYVLTGGIWYEVESDFVKQTNRAFDRVANCEIVFPAFRDGSEAAYPEKVCAEDDKRFALMDQKDIFIAKGQSPVEFCDLSRSMAIWFT